MYRHPFANPELLYGRAVTPENYLDLRSPTPGPGPGLYPYRSFMPMASQSSLFGEHTGFSVHGNNINHPVGGDTVGRGRAASLPEPRQPHPYRYAGSGGGGGGGGFTGGDMMGTWSEGFDDAQSEPARTRSTWKRALKRMRRRAQRGLRKVRAFLHRDDRRSISGFS